MKLCKKLKKAAYFKNSASHAIAGLFAIPVNSPQPEELVYTDLALIPGYRRPLSGDFQMATVIFDSLRPVIDAD